LAKVVAQMSGFIVATFLMYLKKG